MTRQPSERTRVEVLLEEMRDQIRLVLEGHSLLNARVDRLEQRMDARFAVVETALLTLSAEMREMRTRFEQRFQQIEERFQQVEERFQQVEERFQQVEERFQQMAVRLEAIDHRLLIHEQLHQN